MGLVQMGGQYARYMRWGWRMATRLLIKDDEAFALLIQKRKRNGIDRYDEVSAVLPLAFRRGVSKGKARTLVRRTDGKAGDGPCDLGVDVPMERADNNAMDTNQNSVIPPDVAADNQAVLDHILTGRPLAPEVARRVRERAERITEEIRHKHGVVDIGVPTIRALRDGNDE
jgi:hypothetical protein